MGRSWICLGILLVVGQAEAVRLSLTPKIGLSYQTVEVHGVGDEGSGLSTHFGVEGSYYLTPGFLPVQLGLGSGVIFQNAQYNWDVEVYGGPPPDPIRFTLSLNNLIIPLEAKLKLALFKGWELGVGTGFSLIHHLSGRWIEEVEPGGRGSWWSLKDDELETDLGFGVDLSLGYRFLPMLMVVPGVRYQLNLTSDDPGLKVEYGSAWSLSIGFGLNL